jgi:hypothetical protein
MPRLFYGLHLGALFLYASLTVLNGDGIIALRLNRAIARHLNLALMAETDFGRVGAGLASDGHRSDINFDSSYYLHFKIHRQRFCGPEGEDTPEHNKLSSSFLAVLASWRFIIKIPNQFANSLIGFSK